MIKKVVQRIKKDFLTLKAYKSFYELLATLTNLLFLVYFNTKRLIKLEINASSYVMFRVLLQKQDLR